MNYMEEVAQMLGLEIGQEFEIVFSKSNKPPIKRAKYVLKENDLYISQNGRLQRGGTILIRLLNGELKVLEKSYMRDVARLLGVKMEEEFKIDYGDIKHLIKNPNDKFQFINRFLIDEYGTPQSGVLMNLINGDYKVIKLKGD